MARDFDKGKRGADWYRYPSRPGGPRHDELPPRRGSERPKPRKPFRPNRPGRKPARFQPPKPSIPRPRTPRPVSPKPRVPSAGRFRLPRLPLGRVPWLDVVDYVDEWVNPSPNILPILPANYEWCSGPVDFPNPGPGRGWSNAPLFQGIGSCSVNVPISGQAGLVWEGPVGYGPSKGAANCYWSRAYIHASGAFRRGFVAGCITKTAVLDPQPLPYRVIYPQRWGNPNEDRWLPSVPDPFSPYVPGFAEGLPSPEGFANPELPYQPDYQWQYSFDVGLGPATIVDLAPGIDSPGNVGQGSLPPTRPVGREPPGKGENQSKVITKSAKAGIALYRALDAASETSEIVDALYEALPDDVRKRWKCPDNRMGDSFGQYGFANADCKARALYYNLHRLDVVQGLKNIVKNQLEDSIIGAIQSKLPKNSGQAHSQGEKRFAKELDKFLCEELGLCDGDEDYERET